MIKQINIYFEDYPNFQPNLSPKQMFKLGIFGRSYFRKIYCTVNKKYFTDAHKEFTYTVSENNTDYDVKKNYYQSACGCDLDYWQSKSWIHKQDPYGWVQWYCRFYSGRRTEDDMRQISRWKRIVGKTGRFRFVYDKPHTKSISNRLKQVFLHWGVFYEFI